MNAASEGKFRWLHTGRQFLRRLLAAIRKARTSIRLELYIFSPDATGHIVAEALVAAARRGVKVRVLVDALGSDALPSGFWLPLETAGGQVREFNPIEFRRFPIRNHRKVLVVDDELAGVGGFNVADEYTGDGVVMGWADLGLGLSGPVAQALGREFDRMWSIAEHRQQWFARLLRGQRPPAQLVTPGVELLLSGPGRASSAFQTRFCDDLRQARDISLVSAYFLPTLRQRHLFREAAKRGARVRIITPGKSDVALAQRAARHLYSGLMRAGIEIYEYQPQVLHAKLMVLDEAVYVGSSNLDTRSLHINYEVMLRVTRPEVLAGARESFAQLLARSERIEPRAWRRSRSWLTKLREQWSFWLLARVDPYVTRWVALGPR
jgi:cardiolipin synthase